MRRRLFVALPSFAIATLAVFSAMSRANANAPMRIPMQARHTLPAPESMLSRPELSPAQRGVAADVARGRGLRDLGRIGPAKTIDIGILLRARNENELKALSLMQGNRRSPYFHRYLTSQQFNAYFAPSPAQYQRAMQLIERRGFRVTRTYANRGFIVARGTAATAERYFSTQIHSVDQSGRGLRYANVTPAIMPAELRDIAVSVSGLHSIVTMHHPMRFADKRIVMNSSNYRNAVALERKRDAALHDRKYSPLKRHPDNVPTPLTTSTPGANPSPDATIAPGDPTTEFLGSIGGYGPDIYVNAYDYPVQHGYGGAHHSAASVIEADYLDSDAQKEYTAFGIPRTGNAFRECWNPTDGGATCYNTIGQPDPEGESTLDALTIMAMAPAADFYEYLAPQFNDLAIEGAYEMVLSQNYAEAVNSSFGGCETDDPSFGYATNYIAMEGAVLGISFEASTGDTGATNCGVYAANGAPQSEINTSLPSSDDYFTAVGGTDFYALQSCTGVGSSCYTNETGWTFGGGGYSVFNAVPEWQAPALAGGLPTSVGSTTMRNTPDVAFSADELPPGNGIAIYYNGNDEAIGGTSVASPMWTALQVEINQVQHSRNGFVNPGLYAVEQSSTLYAYAFRDITGGVNARYVAGVGYDDSTGIGSPLGWELASVENGTPGATAAPIPSPSPTPGTPTPTPTASPTPISTITPHPSGSANAVKTIAGSGMPMSLDATGIMASFDEPTGIAYTATGQGTDPYLFIADFSTGFLRALDLTTSKTTTENSVTWNNATRSAMHFNASNLFGLGVGMPSDGSTKPELFVEASGDSATDLIALPTTPNPAATPSSETKAEAGQSTIAFDTVGNIYNTSATNTNLYSQTFTPAVSLTFTTATTLPSGNNGLTTDGKTPQGLIVANAMTNSLYTATETQMMSTIAMFATGTPLNRPEEITTIGSTYYVANCGGNNIIKVTSAAVMTVLAGDGAPRELDGNNTGAEFNCPFGITNDGTNLYVTDFGGDTIREITNLQ